MKKLYEYNKKSPTGVAIKCPSCGSGFIKKSYQQAFCNNKCKDKYWNIVDENKRNNTSRISEAREIWLKSKNKGEYHKKMKKVKLKRNFKKLFDII